MAGGCADSQTPDGSDSAPSFSLDARTADPIAGPKLFVDATGELGIDCVHDPGFSGAPYAMPRIVGSGGGVLDFDNDGRLDLYLLQNGGDASKSTSRLYRQDDTGKFVDVSAGSGLDLKVQGMGFAAGDVDNDGRVDVLITEYGRSRLFLNQSDGAKPKFVAASDAGIENRMWGTSCCFVDYDRDGWLDIVLVNYVDYDPSRWCADARGRQEFCGPDNFPGRVTKLFRNLSGRATNHKPIRFEDVTVAAGLATHPGPGLGVFCADFSGDRWPDIFVANDGKPNHLWINQKDGTFKEEGLLSGISTNAMGKAEANMGIAVGDVDGNGLFDVFVTHLTSETHTMWMQDTRGFFQDRTVAAGVTAAWRGTGFGTIMADFDNNGAVDLALVNGKVERGESGPDAPTKLDAFWSPYAERNQVLLNDGRGGLRDVSAANAPFSGLAAVSRGLICADLDNDGGLDLVVTRIAQGVAVYRNVAPNRGHWLRVRAVDPALHRDAYGAEIHLRVGERKQMSWINPGYSYLCSNDPRAHFGLGAAERYDALTIIWPDGVEESFPGGAADREVVLRRGEGQLVQPAAGAR
ncbi:MAG: hypothetical protein DCC68_02700 [Planctomycetota bacterium]|nr:MAG: hypothetical protein DCC68_02700 [Planctomycetota bacterium]